MRVMIPTDPYAAADTRNWNQRGQWPCRWVACPDAPAPPFVTAYRRRFTLDGDDSIVVHVTADERYELFLDGERVGRGSERGDGDHWFFETYNLPMKAGDHVLVARVWSVGPHRPYAQMTVRPGFLLSPEKEPFIQLLGTGVAPWECKVLPGYEFTPSLAAWGTGLKLAIHGDAFAWGHERGDGDAWTPVTALKPGANARSRNETEDEPLLLPATLPAMMDEVRHVGWARHVTEHAGETTHATPFRPEDNLPDEQEEWQEFLKGEKAITIPPHTRRRVLVDLEQYYCAYPELVTTGGAGSMVRVHWQEALFNEAQGHTKGNRDVVEDKYFTTIWSGVDGIGDAFYPGGGAHRRFTTLWWEAGRYLEFLVATADQSLTLERFALRETRYPWEREDAFEASEPRIADTLPIMARTLHMCSHETYMDCPYYEQLMYIGDTRLQALITYATRRDDRLPRKALTMFDASRDGSGLTESRYPSRMRQVIPTFSLWWIGMLRDYALWRGDLPFLRERMIGARAVLDAYRSQVGSDGLLVSPEGWNFTDWLSEWPDGEPPGAKAGGKSGVLQWQLVGALRQAADLEGWLDEPELAQRHTLLAEKLARAADAYWDDKRGLYADDSAHTRFSEHAQCLALLSGLLPKEREARVLNSLFTDPNLARATIYFSHYLFEVYNRSHRADLLLKKLELWYDQKANGLRTTVEMPEPTRSDCHAWGAHPLYHCHATLLGVRPGAPGFTKVIVEPNLGPLTWAKGRIPHPKGDLLVNVKRDGERLSAEVTLPAGVTGEFRCNGNVTALKPGPQTVEG